MKIGEFLIFKDSFRVMLKPKEDYREAHCHKTIDLLDGRNLSMSAQKYVEDDFERT